MLLLANPKSIEIQAKLFRGFSDASRLSILDALREGAVTVTEIVEATGPTQSNVSNHLDCLRDCGLVATEQEAVLFTINGVVNALLNCSISQMNSWWMLPNECTNAPAIA